MFLSSLRQLIIHGASLWHNFVMGSYSQDQTHTGLSELPFLLGDFSKVPDAFSVHM